MDAAAIDGMKESWAKARTAYEHIEGAIAPLFPDIDAAIDERYDGFLETPFGKLYTKVRAATDPAQAGSVVRQLGDAGALLGFTGT